MTGGGGWGSANGDFVVIPEPVPPHYRRPPRLPEIFLLAAMLQDALRCLQASRRGLSRDQFLEAYEWFASERRDWPFSFLNICDLLDIDASALRKRLGMPDEHTANLSHVTRLWLRRASTLPELDDGRSTRARRGPFATAGIR